MPDREVARQHLLTAGLRVTAARLAVLHAIPPQAHLDADEITRAVRAGLGTISVQAVYDVLRALTSAGLLRRIEPAGKPALYEARVADNHHHLVCRSCGAVVDVDCVIGNAPCLSPSDDAGFVIDEAEVTFWGICPTCQLAPHEERE
ncbi:MAG: transcriptional repressor [Actinobacteria bacterium]|nr:transcriptional repressor [Actinomycetota bacterium]MBI3687785.1 transcriptional repressor [Actinomycetota bacterium]